MNVDGYGGGISNADSVRPPVLSVLYVDDEPFLLDICKQYLERRPDLSVSTASSVEIALTLLESSSFDVIVSDYQMPGTDGIGFLKILRENRSSIPFILFTGWNREELITEALNNGAIFYLHKGGNPRLQFAELDQKIREACRRHRADGTSQEPVLNYSPITGPSGTVPGSSDRA